MPRSKLDPPQARDRRPSRRGSTAASALAGLLFHAGAALWIWRGWPAGTRSAWLVYIDLPLSLLWADLPGNRVLLASLVAGGLWWGLLAALLTRGLGRLVAGSRQRYRQR